MLSWPVVLEVEAVPCSEVMDSAMDEMSLLELKVTVTEVEAPNELTEVDWLHDEEMEDELEVEEEEKPLEVLPTLGSVAVELLLEYKDVAVVSTVVAVVHETEEADSDSRRLVADEK